MLTAALALALQGPDLAKIAPLDATNSVEFAVPYDDAPNGSAFDASFLNVRPAGKNGRLVPRDGHFVEATTGKRVNLFGTNLPARAALPPKADAEKIAARLAKMGINIVRLHHMQNGWDADGTIWKADRMYFDVSPDALDRLDFFVAALIKQGIYVNVNLQTARVYQPEMGFPADVKTMGFSKRVDKFNRRMIELQKEYAKTLLDRKNPYLGRKYSDETGVAIVEINNENSLVGEPWVGLGAGLANLPEPFNTELRGLWQAWLKRTYVDDTKLTAAWRDPESPASSRGFVGANSTWTSENQSSGEVKFTPVAVTGQTPTLVTEIASNAGPDWHIQAHLGGLTLENGKFYSVTFRARSTQVGEIGISAMRDRADWHNVGLASSLTLAPEWREYAFSFRASGAEPNASRVGFVLGKARGKIEIANLKVFEGRTGGGLPTGQSIAAGNVDVPAVDGTPRGNAWLQFLTELETSYSTEMRTYLRKDLGFKETNLIDSQTSWGGLTSLSRERESSYNDTHEYWNHPNFVGEWNPKNYTVNRQAITGGLPNLGTLQNLAVWRRFDRPFSVSEYDHPAPSDYVAEMMPLFASFAAFQDWDMLYTFNWEQTGAKETNDHFQGYFDQARNPAKLAFYPLSALIFRQGLIAPPPFRQTLMIGGPRPWEQGGTPVAQWALTKESPKFLEAQVGYGWNPESKETSVLTTRNGLSDTIQVTDGTGGKIYAAESDRAVAIAGFTNGRTVSLRGGSITFGDVGAGLTGTMLAPLDGKPLVSSSRLLLAAIGRAENTRMAWNATRTSVSDQWGTGPSRAEVVPMQFRLKTDGARTVWILDPTGKRGAKVPSEYAAGETRFRVGGKSMGVLFEIAKG